LAPQNGGSENQAAAHGSEKQKDKEGVSSLGVGIGARASGFDYNQMGCAGVEAASVPQDVQIQDVTPLVCLEGTQFAAHGPGPAERCLVNIAVPTCDCTPSLRQGPCNPEDGGVAFALVQAD
jgi:hypothetical protein